MYRCSCGTGCRGQAAFTDDQQARTDSLSWSLSCQAHKHLLSAGIEDMTRSPCCPCLQRPEGDGWCLVATQQSKTLKFLLAHLHGLPIVKPQWVRDSVRAQRPLTYADPTRVMCCPCIWELELHAAQLLPADLALSHHPAGALTIHLRCCHMCLHLTHQASTPLLCSPH